jgi:radical SAM protein with 4Fe4S-binding SPASM domain
VIEVIPTAPAKKRREPAFVSDTPLPGDPGDVSTDGCFHPDHAEVIRFFEKNQVYAVQIESCLSCAGGCRYCYASAQNPLSAQLPAICIYRILQEVKADGVRAIDWLGGDPLIREDWYELARAAQELGLINNIWTSGIPLADPVIAHQVAEVTSGGFVSVHLDSLDEEIYGVLHTGNPHTKIKSVIRGVENLLMAGKKPWDIINCITFTRPLAGKDVERTIRYFSNRGIRTCLTQICMTGLGKEHPEWVPSEHQIHHAIGVRDRVNYPRSDLSMSSMDVNKFYCGGTVCITVDGDVTPCSVIRQGFGNVNHLPFEKIINMHRSELLFLPLREENRGDGCSNCKNQPVCWGCRATAFYTTGNLMAGDPNCRVMERHDHEKSY